MEYHADGIVFPVSVRILIPEGNHDIVQFIQGFGHFQAQLLNPVSSDPQHGGFINGGIHQRNRNDFSLIGCGLQRGISFPGRPCHQLIGCIFFKYLTDVPVNQVALGKQGKLGAVDNHEIRDFAGGNGHALLLLGIIRRVCRIPKPVDGNVGFFGHPGVINAVKHVFLIELTQSR